MIFLCIKSKNPLCLESTIEEPNPNSLRPLYSHTQAYCTQSIVNYLLYLINRRTGKSTFTQISLPHRRYSINLKLFEPINPPTTIVHGIIMKLTFPRYTCCLETTSEFSTRPPWLWASWPWTWWSKVQVDRPSGGANRGNATRRRKEKEKGASRCARGPKKKRFLVAFDESETAFERTNAPTCIWAPLNQWPSYENRSLFTVSSRATDLIYPRLASLLSRRRPICIYRNFDRDFARFLDQFCFGPMSFYCTGDRID